LSLVRALLKPARSAAIGAWRFMRQASGDDAYERYLAHMARSHPGEPVLRRSEHFRLHQERKWNGIKRCC
jgi:uncharacterized short protein YbdD (DUF466 family)